MTIVDRGLPPCLTGDVFGVASEGEESHNLNPALRRAGFFLPNFPASVFRSQGRALHQERCSRSNRRKTESTRFETRARAFPSNGSDRRNGARPALQFDKDCLEMR